MTSLVSAAPAAPSVARQIWVYNHVRTKQVVYSLHKVLDNNKAIAQIPFMGKKTVPASLRKDMWRPLCVIEMPSDWQRLRAYQELREFKKRHNFEWSIPDLKNKDKRQRKRILMNEKPNTIADVAAVLTRQSKMARTQARKAELEQRLSEEAVAKAKGRVEELQIEKKRLFKLGDAASLETARELKAEKIRLTRMLAKPDEFRALQGVYTPVNDPRPAAKRGIGRKRGQEERPLFTMEGISIAWTDALDAHYARYWPPSIVHTSIKPAHGEDRYIGQLPDPALIDTTPTQLSARKDTKAMPTESNSPAQSKSRLRALVDRLQGGSKAVHAV